MKGLSLLILLGLLLAPVAQTQRIEVIPPSGQWVTDEADLLTPAEEQLLSQKLAAYADTTSTQIVIVTLPTLGGIPAADYAVELGRRWGVGQRAYNNGIVILVAREEREVFIATGYGLEGAVPDALASRIVREVIVPRFRQGDFYGGLSAAVDALIAAAQGEYQAPPRAPASQGTWMALALLFAFLIVLVFLLSAARNSGRPPGSGSQRVRSPYRSYRHHADFPPVIIWGGGGGGFGGGGWGGFSGGGGSFGGGGAGGRW